MPFGAIRGRTLVVFAVLLPLVLTLGACVGSSAKAGETTCARFIELWGENWNDDYFSTDGGYQPGSPESKKPDDLMLKMMIDHGFREESVNLWDVIYAIYPYCADESNRDNPIENAIPWHLPTWRPN